MAETNKVTNVDSYSGYYMVCTGCKQKILGVHHYQKFTWIDSIHFDCINCMNGEHVLLSDLEVVEIDNTGYALVKISDEAANRIKKEEQEEKEYYEQHED